MKKHSQNNVISSSLSFISLKLVLQRFLDLPNVLDTIQSFLIKCKTDKNLQSVIQGQFWKCVMTEQNEYIFFR